MQAGREGAGGHGRAEKTAPAREGPTGASGSLTPPRLPSVLEVHQFAQEAVVADAWLTAQEPILQSRELGSSVDEVEQLIRRHEAFRKAAAAWEERFSSLRRLTTVSTSPCPAPPHPTPPLYRRQAPWLLVLRALSSEVQTDPHWLPVWQRGRG